ncbi:GTPase-activating protein [Alteromonas pelagimontana]|uniref:Der GTPase-activating protein YihI n=1 Tax=Alteromonas pelagimontana TaxID=1858656 RepID=A0A6M4MD93_9ALTE|nr:Der GTPase-activating protein YihI [Alteromonas pelagimontana]QJR80987.1 GTPase-activating protein [Alteromonas pelagimontana]
MAKRSKKSRKVGLIGVRKDPNRPPGRNEPTSQKPKKHKGKPAGSRHNVEQASASDKPVKQKQDPRVGSKKPIPLVKAAKSSSVTPSKSAVRKYATPAEELAALEADPRLSALLDKIDSGKTLRAEEQEYVDENMARHQILCDLLGISPEADDEDDDPLAGIESLSIDDFKK